MECKFSVHNLLHCWVDWLPQITFWLHLHLNDRWNVPRCEGLLDFLCWPYNKLTFPAWLCWKSVWCHIFSNISKNNYWSYKTSAVRLFRTFPSIAWQYYEADNSKLNRISCGAPPSLSHLMFSAWCDPHVAFKPGAFKSCGPIVPSDVQTKPGEVGSS